MYSLQKIPGFTDIVENLSDKERSSEICKNNGLRLISYYNSKAKQNQYILKYDKNIITEQNTDSLGLSRSIILNEKKEVLSFAPPKSYNNIDLIESKSNITFYSIEDFAEGTMIHLYYVNTGEEENEEENEEKKGYWDISTRSNIGGNNYFYNNGDKNTKTFKEMFDETCELANFDLNKLPKQYCYNFVLKHPLNRIVQPVIQPCLILTNVYKISNYFVHKVANSMILNFVTQSNHFGIIHTYETFSSDQDINVMDKIGYYTNLYCSDNTNSMIQGIVIQTACENEEKRYKIRNPNYEIVKKLKGNNPRLQFHYLSLRKENKVTDYIKFYGKAKEFSEFRTQMHKVTSQLYKNYISCYIKKEKPLIEYSEQFRTHMFNLHHNIYLTKLKPNKENINFEIIKNYVNDLEIVHQLYFINYQLREQKKEDLKLKTIFSNEEKLEEVTL
tara:strand:- start:6781 stop:8115 length:1335 start_codon:yes stop_codon:yes gene_type:complete